MSTPAAEATDWLQGLAAMGCVFVELIPESKRTRRPWCLYAGQTGARGLASALRWLGRGSGVGILPGSPLWVLDADSQAQVERTTSLLLDARIIPLVVRTPSGGAHFYCTLPQSFPLDSLKNHVCHPYDADGHKLAVDFKFGPRTLLVAPGTVRAGKCYEPASPWCLPPEVDPRMFLPEGRFWREQRKFLTDDRPLRDRLARAVAYLRGPAPVSINSQGGHKTLAAVAAHLVRFLDLDPELAHWLLCHGKAPWNARCRRPDESPYPWADAELWAACTAAVDALPQAGVKAFERKEKCMDEKSKLTAMVAILKDSIALPQSVRVPVSEVLDIFEWTGLPDLTAVALGDELEDQGIQRVQATRKRIVCIPGLNLWAMQSGILEADRKRQEPRLGLGCPLQAGYALMKRVRSLHVQSEVSTVSAPENVQVESQPSTVSEATPVQRQPSTISEAA